MGIHMSNTLEKLERELSRWPGVIHRAEHSGRHPKLWIRYGDTEQFLPFSSTKVGRYGLMQKLAQMRRMLRAMGAERD